MTLKELYQKNIDKIEELREKVRLNNEMIGFKKEVEKQVDEELKRRGLDNIKVDVIFHKD